MDWAPIMGPEKYGITSGPAVNTTTELHSITSPSASATSAAKVVSIHNPLTALFVIAGVTFGLMGFATSLRVGNSSASLNLGK